MLTQESLAGCAGFAGLSTMVMMAPRPAPTLLPQMNRLVKSLPCYRLELGESLANLGEILRELLARAC